MKRVHSNPRTLHIVLHAHLDELLVTTYTLPAVAIYAMEEIKSNIEIGISEAQEADIKFVIREGCLDLMFNNLFGFTYDTNKNN